MLVRVTCEKEHSVVKLSGVYTCLLKKGRFGEDTYVNSDKTMYIYKVRPEVYVMGTRLHSLSFRAFSKSHDLYSKESWNVSVSRRKWVYDKHMAVERVENPENRFESIHEPCPDKLVVYSKYLNIQGCYRKLDQKQGNAFVYFNEEDEMYIYKCLGSCWTSCCWVIGPKIGSRSVVYKK